MSAVSELHAAIMSAWNGSGLNAQFKSYWNAADTAEFPVMHDTEATPAQPYPFCVFDIKEGRNISRMSSAGASPGRVEHWEIPWELRIQARSFSNKTSKSAKLIASELADEVLSVFGGHATVAAAELTITTGAVIQTQLESNFGIREGSQEHSWHIKYKTLLDVLVAN